MVTVQLTLTQKNATAATVSALNKFSSDLVAYSPWKLTASNIQYTPKPGGHMAIARLTFQTEFGYDEERALRLLMGIHQLRVENDWWVVQLIYSHPDMVLPLQGASLGTWSSQG